MSLIFSQLVYVDYYGVGGHGGCGIQADRAQRNNEIVALVSRHIDPSSYFLMNIDRIVDNDLTSGSRSLKSKSNKKIKMRNESFGRRQSATLYRSENHSNSDNNFSVESQTHLRNNIENNNVTATNANAATENSNRQPDGNTADVSRCMVCNLL